MHHHAAIDTHDGALAGKCTGVVNDLAHKRSDVVGVALYRGAAS
ncbi:hypothetical protein A8924_5362 [Saccharopolyspora erythraea NRRL 2338]|uniref:Uncharacterized protein n=2 Tax=Saccharopolyspora erythraea TaxID=1836 RepID=A4FJL8_SACEN|nr:hypothetical protein N599_29475 [Saccharopolyspora erythraea D]PFG97892.1 hypothetical protein A8924_5362 [Saccharopolyspora erythraea NRRL 2338]CAM04243.1 hypothetical protein SACE_4979 [Saccharopolyspora erythraea NRRL 2338]